MSTAKALFLVAASPTVVGVEVAGALALPPPPDELGTDAQNVSAATAAAAAFADRAASAPARVSKVAGE